MSKSKTAIKKKKQTTEKDPQGIQKMALTDRDFKITSNAVQEIKDKIEIDERT